MRFLLLNIIVVSFYFFYFSRNVFLAFLLFPREWIGTIKEARVMLSGGQIWSFVVSLDVQLCFFFTWYGACRQLMVGLSLVIDCLCFFFFSLSWQLKCTIILFVCCLSNKICLWLVLKSAYLSRFYIIILHLKYQ